MPSQFGRHPEKFPRGQLRETKARAELSQLLTRIQRKRAQCRDHSSGKLKPSYKWLIQHAKRIQHHYLRIKELSRRRSELMVLATPRWSDQTAIEKTYRGAARLSALLSVDFEVDHIVPISSDIVCGLNVHWNLQVLAAPENGSKGNRVWPDMPDSYEIQRMKRRRRRRIFLIP